MSGSVTDPTGSVNGKNLAGLVDAYTGTWSGINSPSGATMAQWQHLVLLSNVTGVCARMGTSGTFAPNEITLRATMVGYIELPGDAPTVPPATDLPLTLPAGQQVTTSDGVHRMASPYVNQARKNGGAGSDTAATGGSVTFTRMDTISYEGSYDLWFGTSRVTGSFVAPWC